MTKNEMEGMVIASKINNLPYKTRNEGDIIPEGLSLTLVKSPIGNIMSTHSLSEYWRFKELNRVFTYKVSFWEEEHEYK